MEKCECYIHSLKQGETPVLGEATIIKRLGDNDYLAEYNGVKCHAIFNPFAGRYFVDDVYGVIRNSPDRDTKLDSAQTYSEAGAGSIRLWDQWLTIVTPGDVKALCPGTEVFIMSNRPESGMNGTDESLDELEKLGADGVLLNDIRLGTKHFKSPVR